MGAKYLAEIKARIEIGHETDNHTYRDIPALISEVELLTREREEARRDCEADEQQNMELVAQISVIRRALKTSIRRSLPNSNEATIDAIFYNLIEEAQERKEVK